MLYTGRLRADMISHSACVCTVHGTRSAIVQRTMPNTMHSAQCTVRKGRGAQQSKIISRA